MLTMINAIARGNFDLHYQECLVWSMRCSIPPSRHAWREAASQPQRRSRPVTVRIPSLDLRSRPMSRSSSEWAIADLMARLATPIRCQCVH
jgi:hypothetical protein